MIVLLTDFGSKDPFVGIMKGVMLSYHPTLSIVDLTHDISPQDVAEAAFVLKTSLAYFPKATLFVVVVDPGVGTNRKIIYVETSRHRFLAPDNGILGWVLEEENPVRILEVKNSKYFLKPISNTFHGRDIFAPVAAHLAVGLNPEELGPALRLEDLVSSPLPKPVQEKDGSWRGHVIYIDRFGNLITNLWQSLLHLKGDEKVELFLKGKTFKGFAKAYGNNHQNGGIVLLNSFNTVEVAVSHGNAAVAYGVKKGEEVVLRCLTSSS
jgi:S-adenosylmethionine hydrolase